MTKQFKEKEMAVKVFRLVGEMEDIVGDVKELQNGDIEVTNGIRVVVVPEQGGVAAMPFSLVVEKNKPIKIKGQHVLYIEEPELGMKNNYNEKFGTGIVVASQGLLLN